MDYKIEVYTPEPKRKYGYFTLPILHRGQIVGRLDPKAHRAQKRFEVRAVHLETEVKADADLVSAVAATVRSFAVWHGTPTVEVQPVGDVKFAKALSKKLG
ncbi:MAG: winged helix DNA-binding domain-containing protein [Anaerolineae bacterium]|nr:winged helix DNA-binding domain-containing protein [Anaerolineae bacterium]